MHKGFPHHARSLLRVPPTLEYAHISWPGSPSDNSKAKLQSATNQPNTAHCASIRAGVAVHRRYSIDAFMQGSAWSKAPLQLARVIKHCATQYTPRKTKDCRSYLIFSIFLRRQVLAVARGSVCGRRLKGPRRGSVAPIS